MPANKGNHHVLAILTVRSHRYRPNSPWNPVSLGYRADAVIESNTGTGTGRWNRFVVFLAKVTAHFQPSYMKSTLEKYYDHYPARCQPAMPRLQ